MTKYLIRFDDIHEYMGKDIFNKVESFITQYQVPALLAVIPDNKDERLNFGKVPSFWKRLKKMESNGVEIGQHGHTHQLMSPSGGILGIGNNGEFAGLSYTEQKSKLFEGLRILSSHTSIRTFVAPKHAFDAHTINLLHKAHFTIVSDGIALYPYENDNLLYIPQITWKPRKLPLGMVTICLHPATMNAEDMSILEDFIKQHRSDIISIQSILDDYSSLTIPQKIIRTCLNFLFRPIWRLTYIYKNSAT